MTSPSSNRTEARIVSVKAPTSDRRIVILEFLTSRQSKRSLMYGLPGTLFWDHSSVFYIRISIYWRIWSLRFSQPNKSSRLCCWAPSHTTSFPVNHERIPAWQALHEETDTRLLSLFSCRSVQLRPCCASHTRD